MKLTKLQKQIQVEVDMAFLYASIAAIQTDENLKKVLFALSEIETGHADKLLEVIHKTNPGYKKPKPSNKAKVQLYFGRLFGYDSIISSLTGVEREVAKSTIKDKLKKGEKISGYEHNQLKIIEAVSNSSSATFSGGVMSKFEGRHKSVGGNALRAAVLGANDGLVSNMCLVLGVAGAAAANKTILLTGIAGLLAGAISMALGEWLSVQSSRELHLQQIALETEELEASPEAEQQELALLYQAKGMDVKTANELAAKAFETKETALDALIIEELGIDKDELGGSAWEAAFSSFALFVAGAIIPLIPFIFTNGKQAIYICVAGSALGLFLIGSAITLFTGKSILFSGFRQVMFGLAAAAVTYGIGMLIGVSLAG
jgi:VIT1/CCC1 family predicted Fe2+/Mn2+ transporter